jgi:hypothetical protein
MEVLAAEVGMFPFRPPDRSQGRGPVIRILSLGFAAKVQAGQLIHPETTQPATSTYYPIFWVISEAQYSFPNFS